MLGFDYICIMYYSDLVPEGLVAKENHIDNYIGCCEIIGDGEVAVPADRSKQYHFILLCDKGELALEIDGKYRTGKACITNVSVNSEVRRISYSKNFHGFLVAIDFQLLLEILRNRNPFPNRFLGKFRRSEDINSQAPEKLRILSKDCRNLMGALGNKTHRLASELNYAHLYILLTDIADIAWASIGKKEADHKEDMSRPESIMRKFMELAGRNIEKEVSIGFYANQLCISKQYLSEVVKKHTGHTIGVVLSTFRYEWCMKYVNDSSLSIKEIADKMGFPDQATFGKFFKKHKGMSPSNYRKQMQKNLLINRTFKTL